MKLIKRKIKTFENFIQNPKDPNEKHKKETTKKKTEEPDSKDEEAQDTPEKEPDLIDELNEYFEKQKINREKWKSTML